MSEPTRDLHGAALPASALTAAAAGRVGESPAWGIAAPLNRIAAGEPRALADLVAELARLTGSEVIVVERYDPARHHHRVVAHLGLDGVPREALEPADGRTLFGALPDQRILFAAPSDAPAPDALRRLEIEHFCCVPVRCGAQLLGALSLASRSASLDDGLGEALPALADHLGAAWSAGLLRVRAGESSRLAHAARSGWVLAHELRNPLHAMALQLAGLRLALDELSEPRRHALEEGLEILEAETLRLHDLLDHYLRLGRQRGPRRTRVQLDDLIEGVLGFYRCSLEAAGVDLVLSLPEPPPTLDADVAQLTQVLHNLLRNALDAMPLGGRLELSARTARAQVEIELRDTGPGISDPQAALSFFASTREDGMGLGLPVSREILRAHGGELRILPSNSGAVLQLTIPCSQDP